MKHALGKCRDASPMSWYRMVLLALQQAFTALREGGGGYLDQAADEWTDLKVVGGAGVWAGAQECVGGVGMLNVVVTDVKVSRAAFSPPLPRSWLGGSPSALGLIATTRPRSGSPWPAFTGAPTSSPTSLPASQPGSAVTLPPPPSPEMASPSPWPVPRTRLRRRGTARLPTSPSYSFSPSSVPGSFRSVCAPGLFSFSSRLIPCT